MFPIWLGSYPEGGLHWRRSGVYHELPWPSWLRARAEQNGCTKPEQTTVAKQQQQRSPSVRLVVLAWLQADSSCVRHMGPLTPYSDEARLQREYYKFPLDCWALRIVRACPLLQ